jgi:hypothetical protein
MENDETPMLISHSLVDICTENVPLQCDVPLLKAAVEFYSRQTRDFSCRQHCVLNGCGPLTLLSSGY